MFTFDYSHSAVYLLFCYGKYTYRGTRILNFGEEHVTTERNSLMKQHRLITGFTTLAAVLFLGACGNSGNSADSQKASSESTQQTTSSSSVDLNSLELPQLSDKVTADETVVEMETTAGNIKIKLFPKIAPKAVENFVTHAKEGYYNGTKFHRAVEDFMIQGGDPNGDGTGGESIWGEGFELEASDQLYNIRGALAMARSQDPNSNGSQFFIIQNDEDQSDGLAKQYYPEAIIEAYKKGGMPALDGQYTVFGQVIDNGMETVDKIATAEKTDEPNSLGEYATLKKEVKINKINIIQEAK